MTNYMTPTEETYAGLEKAFDHFNEKLFEKRLPPVLFTLTRKGKAHGYFWPEQFKHRDGDTTHEIALNPNTMDRNIEAVLATLVHEMTHLEQQEYGTPSKGGHHNMEWVGMMQRVGLIASNTGEVGGAQTGRQMTHYIDENGPFVQAFQELMPFDLPYFTMPLEKAEKKKDLSKVKHQCGCGQKAWAKAGSRLVCGDCNEPMIGEV